MGRDLCQGWLSFARNTAQQPKIQHTQKGPKPRHGQTCLPVRRTHKTRVSWRLLLSLPESEAVDGCVWVGAEGRRALANGEESPALAIPAEPYDSFPLNCTKVWTEEKRRTETAVSLC